MQDFDFWCETHTQLPVVICGFVPAKYEKKMFWLYLGILIYLD